MISGHLETVQGLACMQAWTAIVSSAVLGDRTVCMHEMGVAKCWRLPAGRLPTLELYSTLRRTAHENESIIEQSVDGMDLAAAAYFRRVVHLTAPDASSA